MNYGKKSPNSKEKSYSIWGRGVARGERISDFKAYFKTASGILVAVVFSFCILMSSLPLSSEGLIFFCNYFLFIFSSNSTIWLYGNCWHQNQCHDYCSAWLIGAQYFQECLHKYATPILQTWSSLKPCVWRIKYVISPWQNKILTTVAVWGETVNHNK